MILLDWLFQDELLFQYIAGNLVEMVSTKEDRFITLGWCTFVRGILEHERAMNQYPMNGEKIYMFSSPFIFSNWLGPLDV